MRIATASFLATAILAGNSFAEDHRVTAAIDGFHPEVIRAAPGETVTWRYNQWNGGVQISSGDRCTADGLFQFSLYGGPFGNYEGTWEIPEDFAYGDVPYFNQALCKDGVTGVVRIIELHEVPSEYPTIQAALDAAAEYDVISIAPGTYYETDIRPGFPNIRIQGALDDEGLPTVFLGPEPGTVSAPSIMTIDGVEGIELESIHFTGGRGDSGGAIAVDSGSLAIRDCRFTDNTALTGGCLSAIDAAIAIEDCTFDGNAADDGACVHIDASDATVTGSRMTNNAAEIGGAMSSRAGTIIIDDCWFGTNTASSLGGALFLDRSTASVGDSMFCTNTPDQISGDWVDEGGVAFRDDCPVYDRVTHFVSTSNGTFSPQILRVEPGDTVFWWVDVTSGEPCAPDGLFEFTGVAGPPTGPAAVWEVPLNIPLGDIPYFNPNGCEEGMAGIIRVVDILKVPAEFATIQEAIDTANPGGLVSIAPGTYPEIGLVVSVDDISIEGGLDAKGQPAVVLGPEPGTISSPSTLTIDGAEDVELVGIHFTGARGVTGGGVAIESGSAGITDCLFTDNESLLGGGLSCISGSVRVTDCTFRDNTSEVGGAAFLQDSGAIITGCLFEQNAAFTSGGKGQGLGGGIAAGLGTLTITESVLRDNDAVSGGGIHLSGGSASIGDTRICGNGPDQIFGTWTNQGNTAVRETCSDLFVPEDFPTIESAFEVAQNGDTVYIAAGSYIAQSDDSLILEGLAVSVIGETNADGTPAVQIYGTIGCWARNTTPFVFENLNVRNMYLYDAAAMVTNCNIEFGSGQAGGLALLNFIGAIRDCRVANCSGQFLPGGVYVADQLDDAVIPESQVDFIDCVVEGNTGSCPLPGCSGSAGVGIYSGVANFTRTVIRNNNSGFGGLRSSNAQLSLTDTTVCGNSTPGQIIGAWTDNGGNTVIDKCPEECPGDFNDDGSVDGGDLGFLLAAWGGPDADINGDGNTDGGDLGLFLSVWGDC